MMASLAPWIFCLLAVGGIAFAAYKWGGNKQKSERAVEDAKQFKKVAQDFADAPGTDDDFHRRMRARIDRKD